MSENQSSKPVPHADNKNARGSRIDGVNKPLAGSEQPMTIESAQQPEDDIAPRAESNSPKENLPQSVDVPETDALPTNLDAPSVGESWETAHLPGTVDVKSAAVKPTSEVLTAGLASDIDSARESELLMLIHDLNECNDVLLSRVSQLETALDDSKRLLQEASKQSRVEKEKLAGQLSTEQLNAQQVSQNAQQQVAQLVAQLETAEQALQRQQLMNETLQSELNNAQERVGQLEHDCAVSAQKHAEEAQARVQAETTIRDLRSRLHRQQRYTLQFKAALEKSLTVTARSASAAVPDDRGQRPFHPAKPTPFSTPHPVAGGVTMPRAQQIMPWASALTSPFEGIDPHLESLIRNASTPKSAIESDSISPISSELHRDSSTTSQSSLAPDVAEDKLWQDMERVIENSTKAATPHLVEDIESTEKDVTGSAGEKHSESMPEKNTDAVADAPVGKQLAEEVIEKGLTEETEVTEKTEVLEKTEASSSAPRLNWQRKDVSLDESFDEQQDEQSSEKEPLIQALEQKESNSRAVVIDPCTVAEGRKPTAEVDFTEPSPWGKPLLEKSLTQAVRSSAFPADNSDANEYLPAFDSRESSEVAPTVNPLRTQKKIGSMSAVQLPTFEKAKAGSFKR
ncbi:MAG: hypothetical protein AAF528_06190 [Cyanobacteria bacterium P01_C01_bin.121]